MGSDNGLVSSRYQAIIWTKADLLLTEPLDKHFRQNFEQSKYNKFRKINKYRL